MQLVLELGFTSLAVLVVCAVFPLIGLVLRSKWRRSAARKEEIRRLMILASEETARAELEASSGYNYSYSYAFDDGYGDGYGTVSAGTVSAAQSNLCAVCYSPTTTRCAKCKAVRYCSGKCQIIHWRRGHKDECRPPVTKSDFDQNPSKHGNVVNCGSDLEVDLNAEISSESSGTGFTGLTSTSDESSDDTSICGSTSPNDPVKSEKHLSDDVVHDISRTSSTAKDVDQAKTISPKFASLVNSVDNSSSIADPPSCTGQAEGKVKSPPSAGNGSMHDDSLVEPSRSSIASQEGTLDKKGSCDSSLDELDLPKALRSPSLKNERSRNAASVSTASSDSLRTEEARSSTSLHANISSSSRKDAPSGESSRNSSAGACRSYMHLDSSARSRKADESNAAAEANFKTSTANSVGQLKGSVMPWQYSLRSGSDIAGRYSNKGLFPYELFVKLYTWKEVELHPCGFINCGNSCYANAVLQCLAFTPPLTAYFLQGLHSKMCAKKDWCFLCEFESLIMKAKEGQSPVSPFGIVSRLEKIGSQLSKGREEDAHEFLRYAIDVMESVCLVESRVLTVSSEEEDTTVIGLTFGGYLRSKIRCTKCQGKSEKQERMMDLTVEIDGDVGTLEEALRKFTVSETLDGEDKYLCSRCGSYEKARKKLTIQEAPNVLTIALKRFQSGKYGKLDKSIRYPEILDLAPYMSGTSDKSPVYRLYGVIVHLDASNASYSGHYVCYVKNPQNKWFKIDDSMVTPVDMNTVLKVGAYMLLYSRCSPRAPKSIRDQIISPDLKPKPLPYIISKIPSLNTKDLHHNKVSSDDAASLESFYSKFQKLRRMLEEDSSSDSSSLFSNTSDESSSSSSSGATQDSTSSTDDF